LKKIVLACLAGPLLGGLLLLGGCVSQTTIESKLPDQASPSDPAFRAKVHTERAGEYYRIGNYGVAIEAAQQALAAVPGHAPAYNMLGVIYMQLKQDAKAGEAFEQAMKLSPNDSDVMHNYGWFICERRNPAQSMSYFQAALKNPLYNSPERALYHAGVCVRKTGDIAQAEANFRAALQRQPQFAAPMVDLSDLLLGLGRVKEAEMYLNRYMTIVQSAPADALLLGVRVARAAGDKTAEASYSQQLRRRFPDSPQTRAADSR
jgi:type IV pilus assembly protein PilF